MKKIVYIVLAVIFIISCSKGRDVKQLIAGDSCQYWYVLTPDSEGKTKYYYYFNRSGKWIALEESYRDQKIRLPEMDDVICEPTWMLRNDTVISMGGLDRSLEIVNDTFLIITTDKYHWTDTLYKVTNPHLLKKLQEVKIP
ncbi:hypothetical protein SAMN06298211_10377 [Prevotellaceae bacterium MN60]|nr:hypothetical protein SAMN06298211_10377 [Prevotellaceae bacterium MN60]